VNIIYQNNTNLATFNKVAITPNLS